MCWCNSEVYAKLLCVSGYTCILTVRVRRPWSAKEPIIWLMLAIAACAKSKQGFSDAIANRHEFAYIRTRHPQYDCVLSWGLHYSTRPMYFRKPRVAFIACFLVTCTTETIWDNMRNGIACAGEKRHAQQLLHRKLCTWPPSYAFIFQALILLHALVPHACMCRAGHQDPRSLRQAR